MYELGVVYRNIQRADRAAADGLAALGSATVHEAMGRVGLLKPYMRPIYAGQQVWHGRHRAAAARRQLDDACGRRADPARRHRGRGRDLGMHGRLLRRPAGHQLPGARRACADHRCRRARREDAAGNELPVWSRAISSKGTIKATLGSVNIPVVCAGMWVTPGDVIVADDDGVVCVPAAKAAETLAAAQKRELRGREARQAGFRRAGPGHVQDARAARKGRPSLHRLKEGT